MSKLYPLLDLLHEKPIPQAFLARAKMCANTALLRLLMGVCVATSFSLFLTVLVYIGEGHVNGKSICINETKGIKIGSEPCFSWHLDKSPECVFNLLFAAIVLLGFILISYVTGSIIKCVCPEFAFVCQRRLVCQYIWQYYSVVINLLISAVVLIFFAFIIDYGEKKGSCYHTADLIKNCSRGTKHCWMLILLCVSFAFCLFALLFSGLEARLWYRHNINEDERERIYQRYIDYGSYQEVTSHYVN